MPASAIRGSPMKVPSTPRACAAIHIFSMAAPIPMTSRGVPEEDVLGSPRSEADRIDRLTLNFPRFSIRIAVETSRRVSEDSATVESN